MAKKKKKSFWKKAGKAALIAGALYGAAKLGKGRLKGRADKLTEGDIGIGQRGPGVDDYNYIPKPKKWDLGGIEGPPSLAAKGGRIGAKHGGHVKSMGVAKRGGGVAKR